MLGALTQQHPDNNKNNDRSETSTPKFGSSVAGDKSFEYIIHNFNLEMKGTC